MNILYVTRWLPDEHGGGTAQRAATHLRALAGVGHVHLLVTGDAPRPLDDDLGAMVASQTRLGDLRGPSGAPFHVESRGTSVLGYLRSAWSMSGLVANLTPAEAGRVRAALPVSHADLVFAVHLGAARLAGSLDIVAPAGKQVIDWDFLESPHVIPWARATNGGLSTRVHAAAWLNRLRIRHFERAILREWDGHLHSSAVDARWLEDRVSNGIVRCVTNAVSVPARCPAPPAADPPTAIFVGSLTYWPNLDGILHFLDHVWPRVRRELAHAQLRIVGRGVPSSLALRSGADGVHVHANVPRVSPYYGLAHVAVAPIRFAVGSNVKIPEAMAHGRAVVGYRDACLRVGVSSDAGVWPVGDDHEFATALVALLRDPARAAALGGLAYETAVTRLSRPVALAQLQAVLAQILGSP